MNYKYDKAELPSVFEYPDTYLRYNESEEKEDLYPWIFIDTGSVVGNRLLAAAKRNNDKLVPFASLELGDGDVACFNSSGAIEMLILDGSGRSYGYANFTDWLSSAKRDHQKWS